MASMPRRSTPACLLALLLSLALPVQAFACPIAIRRVGPLDLQRHEIRSPVTRTVARAAWGLDASWTSARPRVSQFVVTRRIGTFHGVSFASQRAISIDARGPRDTGWMYVDDDRPWTPPCTMKGEIEWQPPKVRVRESATRVRISAASQRTVGDRTGCVLGPDEGVRHCPNLTRRIILLDRPLGARELRLETF